MRNWLDVSQESSLLDEVAQRRQRLSATRAQVRPSQAMLAESYADAYPWMDPGAVQSFVQAGVSPDLPQVQAAADLAAQEAAETDQFSQPSDDLADPWYETLWETTTNWAKPVVRTGFTALSAPFEELQALLSSAGTALMDQTEAGELGLLSDPADNLAAIAGEFLNPGQLVSDFWTNYTEKAARSHGLLALGDLVGGNRVDLGEGFLPGGAIFEERERAKHRLTLDGHFVTPGRLIARNMTEPGTLAWQVVSGLDDAAQNIFLDPAALALGGLSKAQKANRSFQTIGAVWGTRKTVAPERAVSHYLSSDLGQQMVRWLTKNSDVDDVWQALGRADLGVARRLARSMTDAETFDILSDVLGTVIREKPTAGFVSRGIAGLAGNEYGKMFGAGAAARRRLANVRLGIDMPGSLLNPDNMNDAAVQLDRWMRNARVPDELRRQRIDEISNLVDGDNIGLFDAARRVMDDTEGILVNEWGVNQSRARRLTQMYENLGDELHAFGLDALGRHEDVLGPFRANIDGTLQATPRAMPLLQSEMANAVPLPPSVREIRRLTPTVQRLQRLYDSGLWKGTVDGLDAFMSSVWKPAQLLRGAYTIRVIGEEQVRMAGSGYDSLINHPASALAWSLSIEPDSKMAKRFATLARKLVDEKGTKTVTGEDWDLIADHAAAMSRGAAGHTGLPGELLTGRYVKARYGDPDFYRGWTVELSHMSNDPVMRRVAGGLSEGDLRSIGREASTGSVIDDVKEWFWSGTGQKWRKSWARIEGRGALATDRRAADEYIDIFARRLENSTGGDVDLIEAVATGTLEGHTLRNFGSERRVARVLEDLYDSAHPNFVKKPEAIRLKSKTTGLDRVVDMGFDALMSKPTNWLSRSPTFRQKYWQRVEEVIGFADRKTQEAMIRAARDANIGGDALTRMASTVLKGEGSKLASLDDVDMLAKGFALSETKKLLYDLNKRSQFFDMMRVVFPFGEAWKEIIGAWTDILVKNPRVIRRFQQGLEGARAPSVLPGAEPETDIGTGQGFFHPDPQTGEEVFTYPAGWVGDLLGVNEGGAGVSFVGRAAGLNIVSATVLPGFGPAIQYPASKILPETPAFDDLRDILMPFGPPQGENIVEEAADIVLPAWADKVLTAFEDPEKHRLFANTVADVQRALYRTGRYDISTVEGQQDLFDEAAAKAKALYLIRGMAQSTVPTGPSFQWTTTDVAGNVVPVKLLSDELRRMTQEEYGGDRQAAFTEWVRRFGVENVLAIIGKSTALVERPVTEKGDEWLRAHSDLERDFPMTIGFFAPEPAVGEFDYDAYLRQFETGARQQVTPQEQVAMANDFLGRIQWEQAKKVAEFRPGPVTASWLAQVRERIAEQYPGFDGWVSRRVWEQRPRTDELIAELRKAVTNPTLAGTDAGQGTIKYLSAVDAARGMVELLPGNTRHYQQAKSARHIRDWLRLVARQVIEEHPDFARVWHMVFERELADDDETLLEAAA